MAAGTITLAHNSGGPKLDIVTDFHDAKTGFLADSVDTFSAAMKQIFEMSTGDRDILVRNARQSTSRFSENTFKQHFLQAIESTNVLQCSS